MAEYFFFANPEASKVGWLEGFASFADAQLRHLSFGKQLTHDFPLLTQGHPMPTDATKGWQHVENLEQWQHKLDSSATFRFFVARELIL